MTRPEDLIYGVDELPPWPHLVFLGAQHAVLMSVYLVLIVIVFRSADASHAATLNAPSLSMIALAITCAALPRLRLPPQPSPGFSDGGDRRDAAHGRRDHDVPENQ
jgi:hypothetical protein